MRKFSILLVLTLTLVSGCAKNNSPTNNSAGSDNGSGTNTGNSSQADALGLHWQLYLPAYYSYEFEIPRDAQVPLKTVEQSKSVSFTHTTSWHDRSFKDGSDLGPAVDMALTFKENLTECSATAITANANSKTPLPYEPFSYKNISGVKVEESAEGKGIIVYCIKSTGGTYTGFGLVRNFIREAYSQQLQSTPDYLPSSRQDAITGHVLNTFQFIGTPEPGSGGSSGASGNNSSGNTGLDSGINGKILVGPTCPVQPANDTTGRCADQPFKGTFTVEDAQTLKPVAQFDSDDKGQFNLSLPSGSYLIVAAQSSSSFPHFRPQPVIVQGRQYAYVIIYGDTGIR